MKLSSLSLSKIKSYIILALIIALILLKVKSCNNEGRLYDLGERLTGEKEKVKSYETKQKETAYYVSTIELKLNDSEIEMAGLKDVIKDLKLKKPKTIIRYVTKTQIDSIKTPFETKLPCDSFKYNMITSSNWYKLEQEISNDFVLTKKIEIYDTVTVAMAKIKNGIFKRDSLSVIFKNENPFTKPYNIEGYKFITPKPKFSLGFHIGPGIQFNSNGISTGIQVGFSVQKVVFAK